MMRIVYLIIEIQRRKRYLVDMISSCLIAWHKTKSLAKIEEDVGSLRDQKRTTILACPGYFQCRGREDRWVAIDALETLIHAHLLYSRVSLVTLICHVNVGSPSSLES